ncbi:MAG: DNA polymerase III subunit gamma/tau [Verrucomicrobiales bacterium]
MSYQVFARKYRPRTFADVLGQDHVVRTLRNAIAQNRLAQGYLFVGPRGTGKTTTARILAKALNAKGQATVDFDPDDELAIEIAEGRALDVLEIDGASNNKVEEVRDLIKTVKYAPARARYRIIYIDEVHMLTTGAFNALLKTLEEPPEHVKFIFATTEPNKILPTIISRCQRFDLRPIPAEIIAQHLLSIGEKENLAIDPAAAWAIGKGADGGMRDALSMLDQMVAFCGEKITEEDVLNIFGFTSRETVAALLGGLLRKEAQKALNTIHEQSEKGKDLSQLLAELVAALRALVVAKLDPEASREGFPDQLWEELTAAAEPLPSERLLTLIDIFAEADSRMKWASNKRLHFEIATLKAIQTLDEIRLSDVIKALGGAPDNLPAPTPEKTPAEPVSPAPAESASPPADPAPPVENPAPPPPQKKEDDPYAGLAALAAEAPEAPPEPEKKPETPAPAEKAPEPEPAAEEEPEAVSDPLITEALEIFKGKLVS